MDWSDEVRARLVREEERLRYKAANLQARGKTVMAAQELVVADDIRAALGEIEECHRIAGEAIGTDPSLRSSACVSALAVHCEWLRERAERAESAMDNLAGKLSKAEAEVERLLEIVMAVEQKFPGETRAQTALRYVREAESRANEPGHARAALRGGGK